MENQQELLPKEETYKLRLKHLGPSTQLFFKEDPLKIVRAEGQYMYDEKGAKYLDCINNVCHVGHCNPRVVEAASKQMSILNTNLRFLHDNLSLYLKQMSDLFPDKLSVFFFCNSGSEANDLSLRLSRAHTGSCDTITLDHAYHGHLITTTGISPYKHARPGGEGKPDWVHVVPCPDSYRGKYRDVDYTPEQLGEKYANEVEGVCKNVRNQGRNICAFIAESMQSCGGQIVYPPGFLKRSYDAVKAAGGVFIMDEVQVGFGRVGSHWWAYEAYEEDFVPDIVTMGKPIGNGHPLSLVVTSRQIANSFAKNGIEFFNTFAGNPVSCAVGMAVLDVLKREKLREKAARVGEYLLQRLKSLQDKHPMVGDVRGRGLFAGLDLVRSKETREPATAEAKIILQKLKENHILLSLDGPAENVLKWKPPMTFDEKDVDHCVNVIDKLLKEHGIPMQSSNKEALENESSVSLKESLCQQGTKVTI